MMMNKYGREDVFHEVLGAITRPMQEVSDAHSRAESGTKKEVQRSEIGMLGNWLTKAGLAIAATGTVIEFLPDYTDNFVQLAVAGGLGAAAIGGLVSVYDRF